MRSEVTLMSVCKMCYIHIYHYHGKSYARKEQQADSISFPCSICRCYNLTHFVLLSQIFFSLFFSNHIIGFRRIHYFLYTIRLKAAVWTASAIDVAFTNFFNRISMQVGYICSRGLVSLNRFHFVTYKNL